MHADLRERIDAAAKNFERAKKSLLRSDGLMRYAPAEHNEMEAVAKSKFEDSLNSIESEIEDRIASAEERLLRLEHSDPSRVLSAEELEEANLRRQFVADEILSLDPEALERRAQAIISGNDRPGAFIYGNLIRSMARDSEYGDSPAAEAERLRLEQLAAELARFLDPEAEARLTQAREDIEALQKIKDHIFYRRRGANDAVQYYMDKTYGSTRW